MALTNVPPDNANSGDTGHIADHNLIRAGLLELDSEKADKITVQDENGNVSTDVTRFDFQGAGVTATAGTGEVVITIPGGGSSSLTVQDENGNVSTGVTQIDFQGAGVSASAGTGEVIVTVPGGGSGVTIQDDNVQEGTNQTTLDFQGNGVSVAVSGSESVITIPGNPLTVLDEGVTLTSAATKLTFAGAGVTATEPTADEILVTIPGGGTGSAVAVVDESTTLTTGVTKLTFAGAGVTATEPATDEILITIPGGATQDPNYTRLFLFSTATTTTDPGSTQFKMNSATVGSVTTLVISETDAASNSAVNWLDSIRANDILEFVSDSDPTKFWRVEVVSVVDNGTWRTYTVTNGAAGPGGIPGVSSYVYITKTASKAAGSGTGLTVQEDGVTQGSASAVTTINFASNVTASVSGNTATIAATTGGAGISGVTVREESAAVGTTAGITSIDFVGAGVTATGTGANATVTIPGGGAPSGAAGGSLAGTYPNPTLAADSVGSTEIAANAVGASELADNAVDTNAIANGAVTAAKLNAGLDALSDVVITTPSTGQVVKYNGTNWVNDSGGGGGGYATIENEGSALTARTILDVRGPDVVARDDSANTQTKLLVSAYFPPLLASGAKHYPAISKGTVFSQRFKVFFLPVYLWTDEVLNGMQTRALTAGSATIRMAVYDCSQPTVGLPGTVGSKIAATEVSGTSPIDNYNVYLPFSSPWTPPSDGWYWLAIAIDGSATTISSVDVSAITGVSDTGGLSTSNTPIYESFGGWAGGAVLPTAGVGGPSTATTHPAAPFVQIRR